MSNEQIVFSVIGRLYNKIQLNDLVEDKTGTVCAEVIAERFDLDPRQPILDFGIKKTNVEYCKKESKWYNSQDLSIVGHVDDVKIWNKVCTKDEKKEINSNYGWCIHSHENYNQYLNCLNELLANKESRRAVMIYTRPSIWEDYNREGMSDFICTNNVQCFIRNNKLEYIVNMRSNDMIFGFFNDFYWHCEVYEKMFKVLSMKFENLEYGKIIWIANSLHVYSSHFDLIKQICEGGENYGKI